MVHLQFPEVAKTPWVFDNNKVRSVGTADSLQVTLLS